MAAAPVQPAEGFVVLLDPPAGSAEPPATPDESFVILLDAPPPGPAPAGTVRLGPDCTLAGLTAVHASLLALLEHDGPVTVDVGPVGAHDGAFIQLLCAFERSARERGLAVRYDGDAAALAATAQTLGLHSHLSF